MLIQGDCLRVLKKLKDNSVDAVITDPPSSISFMGREWDTDKGGKKEWTAWLSEIMREGLRCLKPGGHALVWALPRRSNWTMNALEDAGFELRDKTYHIFGSGFPKSHNIGKMLDRGERKFDVKDYVVYAKEKPQVPVVDGSGYKVIDYSKGVGVADSQGCGGIARGGVNIEQKPCWVPHYESNNPYQGYGTALKPSVEEWILCRKPLSEKTIVANVLKWGTGGLNIDACRVPYLNADDADSATPQEKCTSNLYSGACPDSGGKRKEFDRPTGGYGRMKIGMGHPQETMTMETTANGEASSLGRFPAQLIHDGLDEPWARYFYCCKAPKSDKNKGLPEGMKNTHCTTKNTTLMKYLVKLITPPNGIVLDPFAGSGSTLVACKELGFGYIGIEKEKEYFNIARKRLGM